LLNFVFSTNSHWWNRMIVVLRVISEKQCFLFPEKETVCFQETRFAMWKTFGGGAGGGGENNGKLEELIQNRDWNGAFAPKACVCFLETDKLSQSFSFWKTFGGGGPVGGKNKQNLDEREKKKNKNCEVDAHLQQFQNWKLELALLYKLFCFFTWNAAFSVTKMELLFLEQYFILNFSWAPKMKTQGLHCWSYSQNRRSIFGTDKACDCDFERFSEVRRLTSEKSKKSAADEEDQCFNNTSSSFHFWSYGRCA